MSLYVEVMCDERKSWADGRLGFRCWSDRNANPRGPTVAEAKGNTRKMKWTVRGDYACCPGCAKNPEPRS